MYTGIISAMKEEIQAVIEVLEIESKQVKGMRTYYVGKLYGKPVVLVFSRWGKVASATTATQLINDFKVDQLVFTGVAGAIHKDVQIGDIIVGKQLFQHDMNASPLVETYEVPLLGKTSFLTNQAKRADLMASSKSFLAEIELFLSKELLTEFNIISPKVIESDIASGDQFISNKMQSDKISEGLPTVKCVEMEGAAVAQVCFEYNKPFSIIRTISDNANNNAHVDFPKFAHEIASKYALGILKNYLSLQ
ncbi:5'-methylthioadenosine/adenosylhomocysteine nucleosidase [Lutimonas halocynthiae]|uniref:5'-methylthioadenosine/adenosylhomocysteine nucleosidase n=1 Tax=Lutimonas halocynthiae TaxID=1446477 RepID=UPI0025B614A6|nr:5'-methylthioadenosine/adenosylhomocysteine nucleosidase [Lutimonas halocynthiae]MDN3644191.1 5'-methylthioadenosine/adenosylhomocysteine nucleosidase [Lutimonas halocynthiae]